MNSAKLTFLNDELVKQYQEIPDGLVIQLDAHYDTLLAATSMRKVRFPAHRNRGVSIKVEDEDVAVSVHAVRVKGVVEIHGIILKIRDEAYREDHLAQKEADCTFCHARAGHPCTTPSGSLLTFTSTRSWGRRTHFERRKTYRTGVSVTTRVQQARSVRLFAYAIHNEIAEGADVRWARAVQSYQNMYEDQKTADLLIEGALKVLNKHQPDSQWSPDRFLRFLREQVSGPHQDIQHLFMRMMISAHRIGMLSPQQFEYYKQTGVMGYADFVGMDFAPLAGGGFVVVRGLKGI